VRGILPCRGCLGPLGKGAQAGLCGVCWGGLVALPEERCPRCALAHPGGGPCPDPLAWEWGDALWDYHGGAGALLVPGIKRGEEGWRTALLDRADREPLPSFAPPADLVTSAPTAGFRRLLRGFDLAEETGARVALRLGRPYLRLLRKPWFSPAQASLPESRRRRLRARAIQARGRTVLRGERVLLVDDVWTTGSTLLRCAQALLEAGAGEVRVLALFRAWKGR
jgi:predicted amidophosphoribosyltransferase